MAQEAAEQSLKDNARAAERERQEEAYRGQ